MIKPIANLIVALNGNVKGSHIAAGFAWGLLLGLVPVGLIWIILFLLSFLLFKHNHAAKALILIVVKLLGHLTAVPLDLLGWELLHLDALQPAFTVLYNMPLAPFTRFYNTLVAGGLAAGLALWIPAFLFGRLAVFGYRNTLSPKIRGTRLVKGIKNIPFISSLVKAVAAAKRDL
ncbi:MAG: TIGR03546 family protein [Spirochaetaceae bacterium]|jgi:uncharacterized protein (TIGR03546 family)|nr:TIGR03546 family protein [Spirochaetaceae bacterium]